MKTPTRTLTLRMPVPVLEALDALAASGRWSRNKAALVILEGALLPQEAPKAKRGAK